MIDEDNNLAHGAGWGNKRVEQDIRRIGWHSWVVAAAMTFPMLPPPPPSSSPEPIYGLKGAHSIVCTG